ncbi:MAG: hypothetical protein FJ387_23540 [Verrucomicrobia bacterium]|nr:hypothetical protein [Verrucomicrobiota bacterium]
MNNKDVALPVVELLEPGERRGFLFRRSRKAHAPPSSPGSSVWLVTIARDGSAGLRELAEVEAENGLELPAGALFARVCRRPLPFDLVFPALHHDSAGQAWDFLPSGSIQVRDVRTFLQRVGLKTASVGRPLGAEQLATWAAHCLRTQAEAVVEEALKASPFEKLRSSDTRRVEEWTHELGCELEDSGLALQLTAARWDCAEATRAAAAKAHADELARAEEASQAERDAELRKLTLAAEFEARKRRLDEDVKLTEELRRRDLARLEQEFEEKELEAERTLQQGRAAMLEEAARSRLRIAQLEQEICEAIAARAARERDRERDAARRAEAAENAFRRQQEELDQNASFSRQEKQQRIEALAVQRDVDLARLRQEKAEAECRAIDAEASAGLAQERRDLEQARLQAEIELYKQRAAEAALATEKARARLESYRAAGPGAAAEIAAAGPRVGVGVGKTGGYSGSGRSVGWRCSACGGWYESQLSHQGSCQHDDCAAPICRDCWSADRRRCREHRG